MRFHKSSVALIFAFLGYGAAVFGDPIEDGKKLEILIKKPNSNLETIDSFTVGNRYRITGGAVGRLAVRFTSGNEGSCTGTLIAESLILTAFHCLRDVGNPGSTPISLVLYLGFVAADDVGTPFSVDIQPYESDSALDYAVLSVSGRPGQQPQFAPVGLENRGPVSHEELFIIHHPEAQAQHLTRRACRVRGVNDANTVLHTCDTLEGSSGAALMSDNASDGKILAIHTSWKTLSQDRLNVATTVAAIAKHSCVVSKLLGKGDPMACPRAGAKAPAAALVDH